MSDILDQVLGTNYDPETMWSKGVKRRAHEAPFKFTDTEGQFTALLARLHGLPSRLQGHGNLVYHIDVKASTASGSQATLKLSKEDLFRVRASEWVLCE